MSSKATFWARHPGLAWSNPDADDSTRIRAALLRPRFHRLLDIADEFGLERLQTEWSALVAEEDDDTRRARASVERVLRNIEKGFGARNGQRFSTNKAHQEHKAQNRNQLNQFLASFVPLWLSLSP